MNHILIRISAWFMTLIQMKCEGRKERSIFVPRNTFFCVNLVIWASLTEIWKERVSDINSAPVWWKDEESAIKRLRDGWFPAWMCLNEKVFLENLCTRHLHHMKLVPVSGTTFEYPWSISLLVYDIILLLIYIFYEILNFVSNVHT